jgi:hypothetical protein
MAILDYLDNLVLKDSENPGHGNELNSLCYLNQGLWFLYEYVLSVETQIVQQIPKETDVMFFGNAPGLRREVQELIACMFHWYAVSACNYVKMIGWLVNEGDAAKSTDYLRRVLPSVKIWRDKIGAHFAKHSPRDENVSDLEMSVIFPVSFDRDAFYAGAFVLGSVTDGVKTESRKDMRWSLTHIHRDLVPRYWPSIRTKSAV